MPRRGKTHEEFVQQLAGVTDNIELVGTYVSARTKIPCRCKKCGYEWSVSPNHLLRGSGCPSCAGTARVDPEVFAQRIAKISPNIELLDTYVNARTRLRCRCRVCGHEWTPLPRGLAQGNNCPVCAREASAKRLREMWAARAEAIAKEGEKAE